MITQRFEMLLTLLEDTKKDVEAFNNGNQTAGTRVRKAMQASKNLCQEIRVEVQEVKNAR